MDFYARLDYDAGNARRDERLGVNKINEHIKNLREKSQRLQKNADDLTEVAEVISGVRDAMGNLTFSGLLKNEAIGILEDVLNRVREAYNNTPEDQRKYFDTEKETMKALYEEINKRMEKIRRTILYG